MKKEEKNTGLCNLTTGSYSKTIKELQEKLTGLPLNEVEKIQFKSFLDYARTRDFAFEVDRLIKGQLINSVQDTDRKLMTYMADLAVSQEKMASMETEVQFHRNLLMQTKELLINHMQDKPLASDVDAVKEWNGQRARYLGEIITHEDSIDKFDKRIQSYMKLRNDIRKEIDKNKYQAKSLDIREKEGKKDGSDAVEADFEVMDDIR